MAPRIGRDLGRALGRALAAGLEAGVRSLLRSPGRRGPAPEQAPRPTGRRPTSDRQPGKQPDKQPGRQPDKQPGRQPDKQPDKQPGRQPDKQPGRQQSPRPGPQQSRQPDRPGGYPGDFTGRATIEYRPDPDGDADPGEVVWGWVPFEEDHTQGKDRPVLVIGRDGGWLLAVMLTSKDHDRDAAQEARFGRVWTDIGTGPWDPRQRPSEVRLDRVLRLDPTGVRREGGTMPRALFDSVAARLREVNGW